MTRSQYEVYKAIKQYRKENKINPRVQDICNITGQQSVGTIILHLKNLRDLGYIDYEPKTSRSIKIKKEFKCKYEIGDNNGSI